MSFSKRVFLKRALLFIQILFLLPILWFIHHLVAPRGFTSTTAEVLPLELSTGKFQTTYYPVEEPRGIVIVATGDGGWSNQFEEPLARHLTDAGFAVGGWDCRKFADTRKFNQAQLAEAFNAAVVAVRKRSGLPADTPVWFTGWSTGAEWSLAAAASPDREKHLVGVLPAAPGDRSRYGISASDLLGLEPAGPDTFALADLAPGLKGLRIVQFAAGLDVMDDVKWIESLGPETPHKVVTVPNVPHDMGGAGPRFQSEFDMALQWTLDTPLPSSH
jgi:hypothetical protein